MDPDDPFADLDQSDRTVLKPIPGGRRADLNKSAGHKRATPAADSLQLPRLGHLNPLEHAASGLLALLTRLRTFSEIADIAELKEFATTEIRRFQKQALADGIDEKTVYAARYVLCTAIDEAVLGTPWGIDSDWAQKSLLSGFHNEVDGGVRFYTMLKSLAEVPNRNLELLELMYLCLALGFQGRYRVESGGGDKLLAIREWLYNRIESGKEAVDRTLSPHWQGVQDTQNPVVRALPLWVFATVTIALLSLLYWYLFSDLNNRATPVVGPLLTMQAPEHRHAPVQPVTLVARPRNQSTLSQLLEAEIAAQRIQVEERSRLSKIIIQGDSLFRSGSATVNRNIRPLLQRIAEQLDRFPGTIQVIGHSDSDPISNVRFPDNWALSARRAESVAEILALSLADPDRLTTEGRADREPIASNSTRAGKAKNRRVEIVLIK